MSCFEHTTYESKPKWLRSTHGDMGTPMPTPIGTKGYTGKGGVWELSGYEPHTLLTY